jgi:hypothetical protein
MTEYIQSCDSSSNNSAELSLQRCPRLSPMMCKFFPPLLSVSVFLHIILLLKELSIDTMLSCCSSGKSAASVLLPAPTSIQIMDPRQKPFYMIWSFHGDYMRLNYSGDDLHIAREDFTAETVLIIYLFLAHLYQKSAFYPQTVFLCFVRFSQQTAAVSLNNISRLDFVAGT